MHLRRKSKGHAVKIFRGESFKASIACSEVGRLSRPNPSANLVSVSREVTIVVSVCICYAHKATGRVLFPLAFLFRIKILRRIFGGRGS
jgi:hypothetical protein